jgi:hypothetical protein
MLGRDRLVDLHSRMQRTGKRQFALVLQCDCVMGRVGDHHCRFRHLRHHAASLPRLAHLLHLALDGGVAFGLLELILQFAQLHLLSFVPAPVLEQVVGGGHHGEHGDHRAEHLERHRECDGSNAPTSVRTIPSGRPRSGHIITVSTVPTISSFAHRLVIHLVGGNLHHFLFEIDRVAGGPHAVTGMLS